MRDSGKASKASMLGVIKDINDYATIVQKELSLIIKEAEALSDVWQDEKFAQFMRCVESIKASVGSELRAIEHARYELEKKVGMM